MFNRFDILKKLADGGIVWIEAVSDLETARERIQLFAAQKPGEYVVFSQETQSLIELPWVPYARGEEYPIDCLAAKKKIDKSKKLKPVSGKTPLDAKTAHTVAKIVADVQRRAHKRK